LPHKAHGYWVDVFELLDVAVAALAGYDPHTGRFIQPDPHIQAPEHLQSFNRYSYVLNNPLNATDPTGEIWGWIAAAVFTAIVAKEVPELRPFLAIAWSIALAPGAGFVNMGIGPIAQTAVAGFTSGAIGSGSVKGGMRGMATAMLFYGVGRLADSQFVGAAQAAEKAADPVAALGNAQGVWGNGGLARIGLHALAGCASAGISGGDCGRGAATAGFTKAAGAYSPSFDGVAANTVKYAIIGGTVEVIGGGKFANGATTGAFQYLFNECGHGGCGWGDTKVTITGNYAAGPVGQYGTYPSSLHLEIRIENGYDTITIEGQPGSYSVCKGLRLVKESDKPHPAPVFSMELPVPKGMSMQQLATNLVEAARAYQNNLPYNFPLAGTGTMMWGYNSNSYVSGVLQRATGQYQSGIVDAARRAGFLVPGFSRPISIGP
jgi:hypothetical protein